MTIDFEKGLILLIIISSLLFLKCMVLVKDWIKILLKNQESSVINESHATKTLKPNKELVKTIQFQPIFLFLSWKYILLWKNQAKNIHGLNIFDDEYLYTAYADDRTSYIKDKNSTKT